jgi:undecaprenyl phosphate-alpha-L-ara4FN deformylase
VGIHCWDHVSWQDRVAGADAAWTERQMLLAVERFQSIYGEKPRTWGAAGWQTNRHAQRLMDRMDFDYTSDTRGQAPFIPCWSGEAFRHPEIPTTLPTLDELIGLAGLDEGNVAARVLQLTENRATHVFTAHAELEGGKLLFAFEALLAGWRAQGYEIVCARSLFESLDASSLPRHEIEYGSIAGRSGAVAIQGKELSG